MFGSQRGWARDRTMMGVVEEQTIAAGLLTVLSDFLDEPRGIPFVDDDHVGAIERVVKIQRSGIVTNATQVRVARMEIPERLLALFRNQMGVAPAVVRLVHGYVVATREQFRNHAPQKMRVSVVPI